MPIHGRKDHHLAAIVIDAGANIAIPIGVTLIHNGVEVFFNESDLLISHHANWS